MFMGHRQTCNDPLCERFQLQPRHIYTVCLFLGLDVGNLESLNQIKQCITAVPTMHVWKRMGPAVLSLTTSRNTEAQNTGSFSCSGVETIPRLET